jgi:Cyclin M transmembrane N-terminal domain
VADKEFLELPASFGLVCVALLVLANGFFVATEFAIVAVRRSRLEQLAAEGQASARAAQEVVRHLDTYIAACQRGDGARGRSSDAAVPRDLPLAHRRAERDQQWRAAAARA